MYEQDAKLMHSRFEVALTSNGEEISEATFSACSSTFITQCFYPLINLPSNWKAKMQIKTPLQHPGPMAHTLHHSTLSNAATEEELCIAIANTPSSKRSFLYSAAAHD